MVVPYKQWKTLCAPGAMLSWLSCDSIIDVMVGLHWDENNSFSHYGKPGLTMLGYDPDFDIRVTDQPFLFDERAHSATLECLMNELPERLHRHKDGIEFWDFFTKLTNETPATSDIFKKALAAMQREGLIDVRDKTGYVKRQTGIQSRTDILRPSGQRSLFVFDGAGDAQPSRQE